MRNDGRSATQMRLIRFIPHFIKNSEGSVLVEMGDTKVLCTVSIEDGVPNWMRSQRSSRGWLTAEYSMLPGSTLTRTRRERTHLGGRTQEIQRLIGRSLRGVMDLSKCPDMTIVVDCDVLQADGGTRCASVTGGFVALKLAIDKLLRSGRIKQSPLVDGVCAVSVGICQGDIKVDLNYEEDSDADIDMNVVLTHSGRILELQGTAEKISFTKEQVIEIIDLATASLQPVFDLQKMACEGREVEG